MNDSTEPLYEEGESIRPSVPPRKALSSVLEQLKDEFQHLQMYVLPDVELMTDNTVPLQLNMKHWILVGANEREKR
jgi:hypothetical protein